MSQSLCWCQIKDEIPRMHKLKWKQTLWSVTVADRLTIIWHETIFRAGKTAVSWLIKRCHHRHVFRPNRFLMIQLIQIKRMQMLEKCLSVHVCSSLLFLFNRFKCHWVRSVMHSINLRLGCCVMFSLITLRMSVLAEIRIWIAED